MTSLLQGMCSTTVLQLLPVSRKDDYLWYRFSSLTTESESLCDTFDTFLRRSFSVFSPQRAIDGVSCWKSCQTQARTTKASDFLLPMKQNLCRHRNHRTYFVSVVKNCCVTLPFVLKMTKQLHAIKCGRIVFASRTFYAFTIAETSLGPNLKTGAQSWAFTN